MSQLPSRLRAQAEQCALHGSPLTAALLYGAADDYEAGGPAYVLLRPLAADPGGTVPALRFAGAMHRLVLERLAPELALYYPSVGGTAAPAGMWPVACRVVAEHLDELHDAVRRPVQTNEVGRSAALYGGLLQVAAETGKPLRLLEIGASAGLNLLVDRFAYDVADGVVLGDPASAVRLSRPWEGVFPPYDVPPKLVARRGCDPAPLDPGRADDRLTLTSYVWADQVERFSRLRAALQIAAEQQPVEVERLPASAFLQRELSQRQPGVATVVWHSVVRQYLDPAERTEVARLLAEAGSRAGVAAPLAHLSLEPEKVGDDGFRFLVELTTWPGGRRRVLAECKGHGPPVVWR
ncbi:MAG: hypothetical protein JWN35_293 [Frankiales bacterium]|jgi:hypothetical protein|nr:hypothetical protein [Frankiales bacterium]